MQPTITSMMSSGNNQAHESPDKWDQSIWDTINQAVLTECQRTRVAAKFLPLYGPVSAGEMCIPADTVVVKEHPSTGRTLAVNERDTDNLIELVVEFTLTKQQAMREGELHTAITLATRAANLLSQAEDVVIFQGQSAIDGEDGPQHPLFKEKKVYVQDGTGPAGPGLLNAHKKPIQVIRVPPLDSPSDFRRYGENTFAAISEAYSRLQSGEVLAQAHYGPYAVVLNHEPYADTYAPLPTTLIMPADRIKPLIEENGVCAYYGTGTMPKLRGIVLSLGGNTMDLVVGTDAKAEYLQQAEGGLFRFRVYERFAVRLKDFSSVIRLEFEEQTAKRS